MDKEEKRISQRRRNGSLTSGRDRVCLVVLIDGRLPDVHVEEVIADLEPDFSLGGSYVNRKDT